MTEEFSSCLCKQENIKKMFSGCQNAEERYQKIIELGKDNPPLASEKKTPERIVEGCQSKLYLYSELINGKLYYSYETDALISSGLAKLMTLVYSGESPETVLKCPAKFLEELSIPTSLSPSRSNGLASLFTKMKRDAIYTLTKSL